MAAPATDVVALGTESRKDGEKIKLTTIQEHEEDYESRMAVLFVPVRAPVGECEADKTTRV